MVIWDIATRKNDFQSIQKSFLRTEKPRKELRQEQANQKTKINQFLLKSYRKTEEKNDQNKKNPCCNKKKPNHQTGHISDKFWSLTVYTSYYVKIVIKRT